MRWIAAVFFLFLNAPVAAFGQPATTTVSEEHRALAYRFVTAGGSADLFIQAGVAGFEAAAMSDGVTLTASQREQLRPLLTDALREPARVYIDVLTDYYTTNASADDLNAALAYYESGPGQRYAVVGLEITMALSLYAASGGRTELPDIPDESALDEAQRTVVDRVQAAFASRLGLLEREEMSASGLDPDTFTRMLSRFIVSRLSPEDAEAAAAWAESDASRRLEGASPELRQAEELAMLRALNALDAETVVNAIRRVLREDPA